MKTQDGHQWVGPQWSSSVTPHLTPTVHLLQYGQHLQSFFLLINSHPASHGFIRPHTHGHHPPLPPGPLNLPTDFTLKNHVVTRHFNETVIRNTCYSVMHSYFWKDYASKCFSASIVDSGPGRSNIYTAQAQLACLAEILLMFKGGALFAEGIQNQTEVRWKQLQFSQGNCW